MTNFKNKDKERMYKVLLMHIALVVFSLGLACLSAALVFNLIMGMIYS